MQENANTTGFGKVQSLLWPIHRNELKKILLILSLFVLASINYHFLRVTKESIIITSSQSGAEVLPFLKSFAMLPLAVGMMLGFTFLSRYYNRETLFYAFIVSFIFFILFFALVLYPQRDRLSPDRLAKLLSMIFPKGLNGLIVVVHHWIFTLYYVVAESWNGFTISILLWGFANDVTSVEEARRSYAIFGMGINIAGVIAGHGGAWLIKLLSIANIHPIFSFLGCQTSWDQTFSVILLIIIINCLILIAVYRFLHVFFFPQRKFIVTCSEKKNSPMSLWKSIQHIIQSRYLLTISFIVVSYYLVNNITEILWMMQIKEMYPNVEECAAYMSRLTFYTGILATFSSFFISGNIIRRFGWKNAALVPPLIILFSSALFFYFLFIKNYSLFQISLFGQSALFFAVFFGSIQNCLMRATKYTLFDETKEMAFIPLDPSSRAQGKLAIDGLGSHFGKSGSSIVIQCIIVFFGSSTSACPFFAGISFFILTCWLFSIHFLGKKFDSAQKI